MRDATRRVAARSAGGLAAREREREGTKRPGPRRLCYLIVWSSRADVVPPPAPGCAETGRTPPLWSHVFRHLPNRPTAQPPSTAGPQRSGWRPETWTVWLLYAGAQHEVSILTHTPLRASTRPCPASRDVLPPRTRAERRPPRQARQARSRGGYSVSPLRDGSGSGSGCARSGAAWCGLAVRETLSARPASLSRPCALYQAFRARARHGCPDLKSADGSETDGHRLARRAALRRAVRVYAAAAL